MSFLLYTLVWSRIASRFSFSPSINLNWAWLTHLFNRSLETNTCHGVFLDDFERYILSHCVIMDMKHKVMELKHRNSLYVFYVFQTLYVENVFWLNMTNKLVKSALLNINPPWVSRWIGTSQNTPVCAGRNVICKHKWPFCPHNLALCLKIIL
jgi:hypothetical protein